ncbi:hypothetical protein THTE_4240 [Thermogutta terrifontis]|uniref:Uncharacterized protein n=1 Tax=Thermogutta terrifontis TaxID=1331910 RepID=A0A286RLL7_9BACT|nr:hypothetical protein THTE_4240 [Thermogutta terrifontis]
MGGLRKMASSPRRSARDSGRTKYGADMVSALRDLRPCLYTRFHQLCKH